MYILLIVIGVMVGAEYSKLRNRKTSSRTGGLCLHVIRDAISVLVVLIAPGLLILRVRLHKLVLRSFFTKEEITSALLRLG